MQFRSGHEQGAVGGASGVAQKRPKKPAVIFASGQTVQGTGGKYMEKDERGK